MAEVDPVILKLRADVDRYQADLRSATRTVDQQLGQQERRVKQLENEFRSSTGSISTGIKGLAATLATAFTGRELLGLIDQFTRFQNSLRVAGLEGQNLADVQDRLFETGARYGVSVNALADLYGKAEQAGRELGASQSELLTLTDAVAQSLLVSGVSTQQASGAILGLSQALASGTVRAEEFNQINEGGLRILLEAAAQSERFGGSIARLRNAVVDGTVSSQELYRAILANTDLIEQRASNATLTLSGATQALSDALSRYVGEAASANGVTGALAAGIKALADNLDILIPAIATLAVGLGVGFVTNAVRARLAAVALNGTLITVAGTARATGTALLTAFGGPVGLAISAVAVGLTYVATEAEGAEQKIARLNAEAENAISTAEQYESRLRLAGIAVDAIGNKSTEAAGKVRGLSGQMVFAGNAAFDLFKQLQQVGALKLGGELNAVRSQLEDARGRRTRAQRGLGRPGESGGFAGITGSTPGAKDRLVSAEDAKIAALQRQEQGLVRQISAITAGVKAGVDVTQGPPTALPPPVGGGGGGGSQRGDGGGPRAPSGPSQAELAARNRDEIFRLEDEIIAARVRLADGAQDRADLEFELLESEAAQRRLAIRENADLTPQQRDAQLALIDQLFGLEGEYDEQGKIIVRANQGLLAQEITQQRNAELEREALELEEQRGRILLDSLQLEFDQADTQAERKAIALRILEAEDALLKSRLESIIASEAATEADKERAQLALDALNAQRGARVEGVNRQFEGPLARFARGTKDTDTRVEEAAVRRIEQLNDTIVDAMTNALGIEDPFLRDLISIFLDRNVFGPLAEALSAEGGGGLGGLGQALGSVLGSIFGRASGGSVSAGQIYRVNEGASPGRVEAFVPNSSGEIIPLGRMNAMQPGPAQGGGVVTVRLVLSGDIDAKIDQRSAAVAVEVTRQSAPALIDAAANETLSRASRPRL